MAILERSEHYGDMQRVVDHLFRDAGIVRRLDVVLAAETFDLTSDLREIVELCDQLNSSIAGHGWGYVYGTVE